MFKIEYGNIKNSGEAQRSKCIKFNTLNGYPCTIIARASLKGERATQLLRQARRPRKAKPQPRWMRHRHVRRAAHASDNFMELRQGAMRSPLILCALGKNTMDDGCQTPKAVSRCPSEPFAVFAQFAPEFDWGSSLSGQFARVQYARLSHNRLPNASDPIYFYHD